jgi:gluconokinase
MSSILSIDVGTSGARATLFDERGNETIASQSSRRRNSGAFYDFEEFDANALVDEVVTTIDDLLALSHRGAGQIEFIAISTFWHSLLGIDDKDEPTTPLLTWADTRAAQSARELRSQFDEAEIHARTGCRFHPSYWPAKLRWLRSEHAERFRATRQWLGFGEYLCLRLFGDTAAGVSLASATGLFNQRNCDWDWDFVRALEIPADVLPEIGSGDRPRLAEAFVRRWPALAEARLALVAGDGATNNIGAGCSTKENLALMVGTSGAMRVVFAGDPPDKLPSSLWSYRVSCDRVVVGGALSDGGGLFRWLTESMNIEEPASSLQMKLAALQPDAHGLTVLPFWSGERSTGWSLEARGGIFGLRQQTQPIEIIRAALEAVAYRFALIARALEGIAPGATVVATGNGLRSSPVWVQIIADVLGRPVVLGATREASIRGAALLALEAVGKIASIEEVSVAVEEVFQPDTTRHARYQEGLARQEKFYRLLFH